MAAAVALSASSTAHAASPSYCQMIAAPSLTSRSIPIKSADGPDCDLWQVEEYLASHAPAPKDEFESTADYNKRLAVNPATTPSGMNLSKDYAIVLHISEDHIAYDADRQTLDFTTPWLFRARYLDRIGRLRSSIEFGNNLLATGGFVSFKLDTSTASYEAHNAFGATFEVARTTGDAWGFRIPTSSNATGSGAGIPIPPAAAKAAKPNLYLVLVGTSPIRPTGTFQSRVAATMDDPRESDVIVHYIEIKPNYALVVRGDNGEVLLHLRYAPDGSEEVLSLGSSATNSAQVPAASQPDSRSMLNTLDKLHAVHQQLDTPSASGGAGLTSLNAVQRGAIGEQVRECWTRDAGAKDADSFAVHLIVTTDALGVARQAEIAPGDPAFQPGSPLHNFGMRAVRAVLAARCSALPLPPGMLGQSHQFDFMFKQ